MSLNTACIGVDVGGTNLRFALVDAAGKIVLREREASGIDQGRESFLTRLVEGIARIRQGAGTLGFYARAVGIGVPGLIDTSGLILSSVNLKPIEGVTLTEVVARATGLPVVAVNDANAAAYGEKRFGAVAISNRCSC